MKSSDKTSLTEPLMKLAKPSEVYENWLNHQWLFPGHVAKPSSEVYEIG